MYFLVNASPPKRLDVATSNFADALVSSKAVFAMVYHRLKSSFDYSCFCCTSAFTFSFTLANFPILITLIILNYF